jgi:hypothetical protein
MDIRLTIDGTAIEATLLDNETARDFVSLLPLRLTLEDYVGTEKIGYPPRKLSTVGAPAGVNPAAGDLAYYAPWGNIAIFYKSARYADGLVKLGQFNTAVDALKVRGSLKATIEQI